MILSPWVHIQKLFQDSFRVSSCGNARSYPFSMILSWTISARAPPWVEFQSQEGHTKSSSFRNIILSTVQLHVEFKGLWAFKQGNQTALSLGPCLHPFVLCAEGSNLTKTNVRTLEMGRAESARHTATDCWGNSSLWNFCLFYWFKSSWGIWVPNLLCSSKF
jgi:hypothetical protein